MVYLLYNPFSDNNNGEKAKNEFLREYKSTYPEIEILDFTKMRYEDFVRQTDSSTITIISGGDGTINYLANQYQLNKIQGDIYLYAFGTGNDFLNDLNRPKGLVKINDYLKKLPKVYVNDKECYFVNNVGYGLDGEVCRIADLKKAKGKKYNYTKIAAALLLYKYKRCNCKVTCDNVTKEYKNVWLAPTMNGRFYGGGMMMAPDQDRFSDTLSCVVIFSKSRIRTVIGFLSIFKGNHLKKYPKMCDLLIGKNITVEFDKPTSLQIDGETVLNVKKYNAVK